MKNLLGIWQGSVTLFPETTTKCEFEFTEDGKVLMGITQTFPGNRIIDLPKMFKFDYKYEHPFITIFFDPPTKCKLENNIIIFEKDGNVFNLTKR